MEQTDLAANNQPKSLPRPYYHDAKSGITIYHGDCRDILPSLGGADLVLTDPPYGMGKEFKNDLPGEADNLISDILPGLKQSTIGNVLMFWSAQRMDRIWPLFSPKRLMIWNKEWAIYAPNNVGYRYEPLIWVSGKGAVRKRGDIFNSFPIIREVQEESVGHPTQKPLGLITEIIQDFSENENTVLDCFLGSGTTLVAAKNLGRQAIGIEIEEKYCEIAAKRLQQEVLPLTFDEPKPTQGALL